jgi:hypothetical protein
MGEVLMDIHTTNTGFVEDVQNFKSKIPEFDPRSGDHLWIMLNMYKADINRLKTGQQMLMDHESLLSVEGPGCFYCEKPYHPILELRRCKGHP